MAGFYHFWSVILGTLGEEQFSGIGSCQGWLRQCWTRYRYQKNALDAAT
ncbi:hypothetical protein [Bremerella cremea]|nr:hypothetical protein [Bremerella cremea]